MYSLRVLVVLHDCGTCRIKADCKACSVLMTIGMKNGVLVFRCAKGASSLSVRSGTFLSRFHIDNRTFPWLFSHFCSFRNYTQTSIFNFYGLEKNKVSDWVKSVRKAIAVYLRNTAVVLGGHGIANYASCVQIWDYPPVWVPRSVSQNTEQAWEGDADFTQGRAEVKEN
ncbi:hypothetical protein BV898_14130 [Hypsibius exemplaris]|uniref:Uncharacterized protein n=1 Tax=Hypsibius exemplaris TaxID=2072580 RepID=A0A1W0W8L3_HYPEX|nr:hypothetical protein BV898_14130 [Hypsibius exemplaris]